MTGCTGDCDQGRKECCCERGGIYGDEPAVRTNWGGIRLGLALTVAFYACVAAAVILVRSCQ